ncbi:MAG: lipolytic protein family [Ilumatobacteraceae bacterium]|nr:lipolytic protein family [Ilumatobacteraceae bacterium]
MHTTFNARRVVVSVALAALAVAGPGAVTSPAQAAPAPPQASADAPTPTAARPGKPTSVAAVGDSITQSTGTGKLSAENPKNSWATGWEVNSVAARLGVPTNRRFNLSANGDKMVDFAPQINNGKSGGSGNVPALAADAGLVLVEFGGNDLCRDTVADMTSVETYRAQFKAGLAAVANRAPNALVQVMSVPDIYNLWYIRGAPQNSTYHPESESGQATGINGARFYWDGLTAVGVKFPCQSLLTNPDSYAQADRDRRAAVRTRNKAYNAVLSEECGKVLRCRFDGNRLFDVTSNRVSPPDGPLLPQAQWAFTDLDISRNTASLCPIPGLTGDGCGDHFHPSKQGQGKIADSATTAGRNWTDTTMPTAGATVLPSSRPGGLNRLTATVRFSGADNAGLRGQEVRVHNPDGTVSGWTQTLGVAPDRVITKVGTSYAEVRSLDVNGNLSASTIVPVEVLPASAPSAPGTPVISAAPSGLSLAWPAPADDGGSAVTEYQVTEFYGTPTPIQGATFTTAARSAPLPASPAGALLRYQVVAVNAVGASDPVLSGQTIAPFPTVSALVTQQYEDFAQAVPASTTADVAGLITGTETAAGFVDRIRKTEWYDGAYGPATRLYKAYFLRIPDPSGLEYWAKSRRNGRSLASISQQFSRSTEFQRRYGNLTNSAFIDTIYRNVFDRDPDPEGRAFYLARLNDGRMSRGQVVLSFSESSEYERNMRGTVVVVELVRGMTGKAPTQAQVDPLLALYGTQGMPGVFKALLTDPAYATRALS